MKLKNSQRPKILVLTSTFPRWANDSEPPFVFELSSRLAGKYDITVLAPRAPGSKEKETMAGLRVIRFPYFFKKWENLASHSGGIINRLRANPFNYLLVPFFMAGMLLAIFRLLQSRKFDLIHAHWIIPQGLVAIAAMAIAGNTPPLICTSHGGDLYSFRGRLVGFLKRWIIDRCQSLTVVSRAMRKNVLDMGVAPEKVSVLSMGVDLKKLFTPDTSVFRKSNELLFVGRLVEKKGLQILLEAMPEIITKCPDVHLTVAGGGPLEMQAKKLVQQNKLSGRVRFLGMLPQSDLPALYRQATLAVFPFIVAKSGDQEGLGLVVVEAMGCGCPVIASRLPALRDTVKDQISGILVEPGNPAALAQSIIKLLSNLDLRLKLSTESRNIVVEKYDWSRIAEEYSKEYQKRLKHQPLCY